MAQRIAEQFRDAALQAESQRAVLAAAAAVLDQRIQYIGQAARDEITMLTATLVS